MTDLAWREVGRFLLYVGGIAAGLALLLSLIACLFGTALQVTS